MLVRMTKVVVRERGQSRMPTSVVLEWTTPGVGATTSLSLLSIDTTSCFTLTNLGCGAIAPPHPNFT